MGYQTLDLSELWEECEALREQADNASHCDECGKAKDEHGYADHEFAPIFGAEPLDDDEKERLAALESIGHDLGYSDGDFSSYAKDEPMAIREADFAEYAEELAEEIGETTDRKMLSRWPFSCIDWEKAADDLKADYSSFTYEGEEYLVRSI